MRPLARPASSRTRDALRRCRASATGSRSISKVGGQQVGGAQRIDGDGHVGCGAIDDLGHGAVAAGGHDGPQLAGRLIAGGQLGRACSRSVTSSAVRSRRASSTSSRDRVVPRTGASRGIGHDQHAIGSLVDRPMTTESWVANGSTSRERTSCGSRKRAQLDRSCWRRLWRQSRGGHMRRENRVVVRCCERRRLELRQDGCRSAVVLAHAIVSNRDSGVLKQHGVQRNAQRKKFDVRAKSSEVKNVKDWCFRR